VRRLTLLALVVMAGCGDGGVTHGQRAALTARADRICQNAAVPGIPALTGTNLQTRLAELALGQERRELARLRALEWDAIDPALDVLAQALTHLEAFVRAHARAPRERVVYGKLLDRWRSHAGGLGLALCSQFGFSY
jgi:hypothetical protein